MRITTQILRNPNRIVQYILSSMMEIGNFSHKSTCGLSYMIWRITTQISQNPNRVGRCICGMMEIGDFFAQVKVRLFLIGYANYDPDFTKSQPNRTVYMQYDGNRRLFRTSQSAAFFYEMRITTQISQNPNRVVRYIGSIMEIGDFFAQAKVRLFF